MVHDILEPSVVSGALPELKGKKCAIVLCGGNIDISTLGRVIERALLATDGFSKWRWSVSLDSWSFEFRNRVYWPISQIHYHRFG